MYQYAKYHPKRCLWSKWPTFFFSNSPWIYLLGMNSLSLTRHDAMHNVITINLQVLKNHGNRKQVHQHELVWNANPYWTTPFACSSCTGYDPPEHEVLGPTLSIPLKLRITYGFTLACIQYTELDSCLVRHPGDETIQSIDLSHQVALANTSHGRL